MKKQPRRPINMGRAPVIGKNDLERIAKDILFIETFEKRCSDCLDFPEVAVWNLKNALEEAFKLGYIRGRNA